MKKAKTGPALWQWKALEYLAYFMAITVPLAVSQAHLFGFTSTKSFIAMGIVATMTVFYVWATYRDMRNEEGVVQLTWLHALLGFFAIALGISAIFGVDTHTSWFGSFQQGTGLVYIYAFILWSILIGVLVRRSAAFLRRFLLVTYVTGTIFILFLLTGHSSIGNNSFEGTYLLFIALIGVGLFLYYKNVWQRILIAIGMAFILFSPVLFNTAILHGTVPVNAVVNNPTLLAGQAQGSVLGLSVAVLVMVGLFATHSQKRYKRIIGVSVCIAVSAGVLIAGYQLMTPGSALNAEFFEQKSGARFVYWDMAAAGFLASPVNGYGWGNYDRVYQEYFDPILFTSGYAVEPSLQDPHNAIWSYASTTGILGLFAYVFLIGGAFIALNGASRTEDRAKRVFGTVLSVSLVGYFLQNMFVFDTPVAYLMLFSVIGVALGTAPVQWRRTLSNRHRGRERIIALAGVLVCTTAFIVLSVLPWNESLAWSRRVVSTNTSLTSPQNMSLVGNANDTAYIASLLYAKGKNTIDTENEKVFFTKKYQLFVGDLEYDTVRNRYNYKPYLVKGILENGLISLSGKHDIVLTASARISLERALALNPRTPEVYFNLAQTALYERDIPLARSYIRSGIALAPTYGEGYVLAEALQKIAPDAAFAEYVTRMNHSQNK